MRKPYQIMLGGYNVGENKMYYDIAIVIGRLQPLHKGHVSVIDKALDMAEKTVIVNGHSGFCDLRNPFSEDDVKGIVDNQYGDRLEVIQVYDNPSDDTWALRAHNKVVKPGEIKNKRICVVGGKKDINMYCSLFPTFDYLINSEYYSICATDIRKSYFCEGRILEELLPESSIKFLVDFKNTSCYNTLKKAYKNYYSGGIY